MRATVSNRKRAQWRGRSIVLDNTTTLAAVEAGRHEADAPTLVLLHGLGHWTQAAWDFVGAELEATHRLIAFDFPGFGKSSKPDRTYEIGLFTRALARVIEDFRLECYGLVGHSLGGHVAADFASTRPAGLQSLALLDPGGFARTVKLFVRVVGSRPVTALFPAIRPSRRFVRWTYENAVYDPASIDDTMLEEMYRHAQDPAMTRAFARVYRDAWETYARLPAVLERFAHWKGPTLLVWGREDRYVPIAALETVRKVYPHAEVSVFDRCGHCPNLEFPREVARLLLARDGR